MSDTPTEIDAGAQALYELAGREWPHQNAPQTPWAEQSEDVRRHWKERAEVCLYHASKVRGSEWRSIDDEAKRAGRILAWCRFDGVVLVKWNAQDKTWRADPNEATEYEPETYWPTHWQPLPAPPVGEG